MARPRTKVLTQAERRVMQVLWTKGEASVREVAEALSQERPTAYNTALTLLRILDQKGYAQPRSEGRAFIYRPLVSSVEARTQALRQLMADFFEGSPAALAQHLMKTQDVSLEELATLDAEIDAAEKAAGKTL